MPPTTLTSQAQPNPRHGSRPSVHATIKAHAVFRGSATLMAGLVFIVNCSATPKRSGMAGPSAAQAPGSSGGRPATSVSQLFRAAPPAATTVVAIADIPEAYQLLGSLEQSLGALPEAAAMIAKLKSFGAESPFPLPWTPAILKELGLNPRGVLGMAIGPRKELLLMLPVAHPERLRSSLRAAGAWNRGTHQGQPIFSLTSRTGNTLHCHFIPGRAFCAKTADAAVAAHLRGTKYADWGLVATRTGVEDSLWGEISAKAREAFAQSTALAWGRGREVRGNRSSGYGVLNITKDGVIIDGHFDSDAFAALPALYGPQLDRPAAESPLFYLVGDHPTRAFFRVPIKGLLARMGPRSSKATMAGVDTLTGDVVAFENASGALAMVLGVNDSARAQGLVRFASMGLKVLAARQRQGRGMQLSIRDVTIDGRPAFEVRIHRSALPQPITFVVTAGPLGLLVGQRALVEQILSQSSRGTQPPNTYGVQNPGLASRGLGAMTIALGDPLGGALQGTQARLQKIPAQFQKTIRLMRYALELLHNVSLSAAIPRPGILNVRAQIRTLHRRGEPGDDLARRMWTQALVQKYSGNQSAYEKSLAELASRFPQSRFGKRAGTTGGATFAAFSGIIAAVVIPIFTKYIRRAKASRARAKNAPQKP